MTARKTIVGAILTAALLTLGIQPGKAADAENKYKLRGMGAMTCAHYLEDRRTDLRGTQSYAHWFTGYLSAYNYFEPQTFDIAPNHDSQGLLTYLDLFCSKNKDILVGVAALRFVTASTVYEKRQVSGQ